MVMETARKVVEILEDETKQTLNLEEIRSSIKYYKRKIKENEDKLAAI